MKTETVKATFTNLLFVIGVILLIYGFIQGVLTTVKIAAFDKYPLNSYEENSCDFQYPMMDTMFREEKVPEAQTQEQQEAQLAKCLERVEHDRQVRMVEHIATSISTLIAGAVLVISFRRFIFR